jgi:MFS family permease
MRSILGQRPLRFVFAANVISMLGSGMNSAAVAWYILEATHSEMALGTFAVLQSIPAMLMLPFTGVMIDREDRRRLVMWLDGPLLSPPSPSSLFADTSKSGSST